MGKLFVIGVGKTSKTMIQNPEAIKTKTDKFNYTNIFSVWQKQKNKMRKYLQLLLQISG